MVQEVLFGLPRWLVLGLGFGLVASLCAAGLFYVGDRLFPSRTTGSTGWSGDARRVIEIRQFLDAIGEQYAEDHPVDGQTVEFYLPERDVAITFDARAYYIIERSPTYAVLVEHEMPGIHLGSRLPFETPEVEFGDEEADEDGTDSVDGAFAVLGVPRTATEDQIRSAYRAKVKDVHPDHGGSQDEFRRVREAYTTAKKHVS
ncbi:MAG: J domain-containing protein [Haloarculaceae archaeon]